MTDDCAAAGATPDRGRADTDAGFHDGADHDRADDENVAPAAPAPTWGPFAIAAFVGLVLCTNVAASVWGTWANTRPEALLALSSRNRYLALCLAAGVSLPAYVAIASLRITAAFLVCHFVGRAYSEKVLRWFRRFLGVNRAQIDSMQTAFGAGQYVLVPFFVGSNLVAAISGIHRTPIRRLLALLAVGLAGRLTLMWWLARHYEEELKEILGWLQRNQRWILVVSITLVVLANVRNFVRGDAD